MKPVLQRPLISFLVILFLSSVLPAGRALAHVSADSMPDSVAEVEYSIYLEFKPGDIVVRNKLGMVYYRLGKLPEAVREFSKALKLEPKNPDALDGMGLVKTAQQEYDEAIQYHRQAIDAKPDDMMTYYHLGIALEKKGLFQEAAEAYHTSQAKFTEQYPSGTTNKQAAEFEKTLQAAISSIETKL